MNRRAVLWSNMDSFQCLMFTLTLFTFIYGEGIPENLQTGLGLKAYQLLTRWAPGGAQVSYKRNSVHVHNPALGCEARQLVGKIGRFSSEMHSCIEKKCCCMCTATHTGSDTMDTENVQQWFVKKLKLRTLVFISHHTHKKNTMPGLHILHKRWVKIICHKIINK